MNRVVRLLLLLALAAAPVLSACGAAPLATPTPPAAPAPTGKLSDGGLFRVTFTAKIDPIRINETHAWTLHVDTAAGKPVADAEISVDGGMPAHGHGLPTQPTVTQNLGNGDYLVEGMRFNMPGAWVVSFAIKAGGQSDKATFDLRL